MEGPESMDPLVGRTGIKISIGIVFDGLILFSGDNMESFLKSYSCTCMILGDTIYVLKFTCSHEKKWKTISGMNI